MTQVSPISQQIWDMKYRLKDVEGVPVDKTMADTWRRVARSLAQAEDKSDRTQWEDNFFEALKDFKAMPAGRIMSGAGTDRRVTMFNCFVMGTIPDTMSGIFESLKEAALTMQQGGGIGYDFSTLRPRGARVNGVGADASGPLSFMDVWDAMCRTIMSAGSRRGAMMATMRCDHPDVEQFIEAKRDSDRLRMFNLSVLVTDPFMEAVKENKDWPLVFEGETYKTVKAVDLWDKIMDSTYAFAEPGVIFIDRINRLNNLSYIEDISATNPCVTGATWVQTTEGPKQVSELFGQPFTALVDGKPHRSGKAGFFATGRKPILNLTTREGYTLRLTADHPVMKVISKTRDGIKSEWTKAGDLQSDDEILLNDHRDVTEWRGEFELKDGYLLGLLSGAGYREDGLAVLRAEPGAMVVGGDVERSGVLAVMDRALSAARELPCRSGLADWTEVSGGVHELRMKSLHGLAREMESNTVERTSSEFHIGFLSGLFDTAGSVDGRCIHLDHEEKDTLKSAQRMLLRLGIPSRIKGETLCIGGANLSRFKDVVGFTDSDKATALKVSLGDLKRPRKERFVAQVQSLKADGEEEVFDVQIPGINAFDANGLYVHNCGEQPLPPYGTCLLGSINLARMVNDPFEVGAAMDLEHLGKLVRTVVRMLDNVIDVSNYPLPEQRNEAVSKRRIGLGVTGLADALIMCGKRYGSQAAADQTEVWMDTIQRHAYLASVDLAKEKGAFPLYDADKYIASEHIRSLPDDVRAAIAAHGIRNALLTSIAPTGTISLFADNVSSGLEPVFSFNYTRKVIQPDGSKTEEEVSDYAYRLFRELKGEHAEMTDAFVTAQELTPSDHLVMQAVMQKYIDSSISKTINVPEDISFEDFKNVYMKAYEMGCKGCTTYRPNDITGSVLEVKKEKPPEKETVQAPTIDADGIIHLTEPLQRPEKLEGNTYKLRWPESEHAMYVTINDTFDKQGHRRPFEVFINSKNMEHYAWTLALTRMISAVFRRGGDVGFVVDELKAVFDPRGGHWMGGRYIPSLLAAIGEVIEEHLKETGFLENEDNQAPKAGKQVVNLGSPGRTCPKCNQPTLIKMEGCDTCHSCGYSKCG